MSTGYKPMSFPEAPRRIAPILRTWQYLTIDSSQSHLQFGMPYCLTGFAIVRLRVSRRPHTRLVELTGAPRRATAATGPSARQEHSCCFHVQAANPHEAVLARSRAGTYCFIQGPRTVLYLAEDG
jgi:hypothetical protein